MNNYLVLLNEAGKIHNDQEELIMKCQDFSPSNYIIYRSFSFIEGTGFVSTVKEEIDLVLQSYKSKNICLLDFDEFIINWEFEKYIDYKICELSGGWKKFLSIALFTNQKSDGKIFFDGCRHLSDRLIKLFIKNLIKTDTQDVFFFEYDSNILFNYNFNVLLLTNDGLTSKFSFPIKNHSIFETNYESIKY